MGYQYLILEQSGERENEVWELPKRQFAISGFDQRDEEGHCIYNIRVCIAGSRLEIRPSMVLHKCITVHQDLSYRYSVRSLCLPCNRATMWGCEKCALEPFLVLEKLMHFEASL